MKRRNFIAILGGGVVLGATGGYLGTRTPTKALAPWDAAGKGFDDPRKHALSYAILAPNPHNRQPWMVDLSKDSKITLLVDTDKVLPATDPFNRQITIGLGCFLELLRMAGAQSGYRVEIEPFPQGFDDNTLDTRPVANIDFTLDPDIAPDPLFEFVLERRSYKNPFDQSRKVPDSALQLIQGLTTQDVMIDTNNQPEKIEGLRALTHKALAIEIDTPHTYQESVDLFRIGKSEVNANPDGISFTGPLFDTLGMLGMFTRETALEVGSSVYQQGIDAVMANADTAMGYVWLVTQGNSRLDQLNAGRDWVRVNLACTSIGLGVHPLSQALQEYDEMAGPFDQIRDMLEVDQGTVQMLGRLGYADPIAPSPRWPLEEKLI